MPGRQRSLSRRIRTASQIRGRSKRTKRAKPHPTRARSGDCGPTGRHVFDHRQGRLANRQVAQDPRDDLHLEQEVASRAWECRAGAWRSYIPHLPQGERRHQTTDSSDQGPFEPKSKAQRSHRPESTQGCRTRAGYVNAIHSRPSISLSISLL